MKIDDNYTITGETYNWILNYESEPKIKDGKEYRSTNTWYYPKIEMALNKYVDESLKSIENIDDILAKLKEVEENIKNLFKTI